MRRDVDLLLADLRDALDVQPLDGFEQRVRAHVRTTASSPRRVPSLASVLPPLFAAGLAAGAFLSLPGDDRPFAAASGPQVRAGVPAVTSGPVPSRTSDEDAAVRVKHGPLQTAGEVGATARAGRLITVSSGVSPGAIPASTERAMLVLVPPDQAQLLDQLLAARRSGRLVALAPALSRGMADDGIVALVEIPEIHIEPLPGGPPTIERKPR